MLGVCLIGLFAFVALAVDLGMIAVARTQCQNAADVAALAGCRNLNNQPGVTDTNRTAALGVARSVAKANTLFSGKLADTQIQTIQAGQYNYDSGSGQFAVSYPSSIPAGQSWTAVNVVLSTSQPTYFMKVLGVSSMPNGAAATAVHRPRDIAVVLDFSASMKFGSLTNWEPVYNSANGEVRGYMNPDPRYPQFGHYARYTRYQTTTLPDFSPVGGSSYNYTPSTFCTQSTVANRPNPLCMQVPYVQGDGEVGTPNNHTMTTPNGPPIVSGAANADGTWSGGFSYDPSNPPVGGAAVASLKNAFMRWSPPVTTPGDPNSYVPDSYDWSGYNATTAATPAPDYFKGQADGVVAYVGDKWPNKDGSVGGPFTETASTRTAAATLAEFLGYTTNTTTFPSSTAPPTTWSATSWDNFRDPTWETYGYDLKVKAWRTAGRPTSFSSTNSTYVEQTVAKKFQGYSMGPLYWGKTFFIWPPDPRFSASATLTSPSNGTTYPLSCDSSGNPMCDWRRRFFYKSGTTPFASGDNVDQIMCKNGTGFTLNSAVAPNYPAILAWIKSGPQVLPPNLRAGRVVYYTSIPSTVANASSDLDQLFWKNYIDYVLGEGNYGPTTELAGVEYVSWPEGATVGVSQVALTGAGSNPAPYMNYCDNPSRPRMHFWFGPVTMLAFLNTRGPSTRLQNWNPGTVHEAQDWQLKAGINSALSDIRANHPNDQCGMAYFADFNYKTIRAPMSQDFATLKNVLFYPNTLAYKITTGDTSSEIRAFNSSFSSAMIGNTPNAYGGTDPETGLALAYNLLSSGANDSTLVPPWSTASSAAATGRTGAAKIVIFETDGVPNTTENWSFHRSIASNGVNKSAFQNNTSGNYTLSSSSPMTGNSGFDGAANQAINATKQIVASTTATNPGYSLPNAPARVYAIGYGDLFYYPTPRKTYGLQFLYNVQVAGNTQSADGSNSIPANQIITGPFDTRIDNMRSAMQTIMQSGVQVTLIQ